MRKVAVLVECGHFFESAAIEQYFRNKESAVCPLCRRVAGILVSDKELKETVDLFHQRSIKRLFIQKACDQYQREYRKVAILVECGHFFEDSDIRLYFQNREEAPCPSCQRVTCILSSDEEIQRKVAFIFQRASKRSSVQIACDQYHLEHPSEETDTLLFHPEVFAEERKKNIGRIVLVGLVLIVWGVMCLNEWKRQELRKN